MSSDGRARKEYYQARVENIKNQVTIFDVLNYYGVPVRTESTEVQFPCSMHGDGKDAGFSARAYPGDSDDPGGHSYCWGCQKSRDVIEWVKDKEAIPFTQALSTIEDIFSVSGVPNIYEYFDPNAVDESTGKSKLERELDEILDEPKVDSVDLRYIGRKIDRLIEERRDAIPRSTALRVYYTYDSVLFDLEKGNIDNMKAGAIIGKLLKKIANL